MKDRKIYVASHFGFTPEGAQYYNNSVLPEIKKANFQPLDPWGDFHAATLISDASKMELGIERRRAFAEANLYIAARNTKLLEKAEAILAFVDGSDVDSGVACEIGYGYAKGLLIVGVRTDFRLAGDNEGSIVNLQVEYFINRSGGAIYPTLEDALWELDSQIF